MRTKLSVALLVGGALFFNCALAQITIPLWKDSAPQSLGTSEKDIPILISFLPPHGGKLTPAVVICPGGGYQHLTMDHEGRDEAKWFQAQGVAAFVLRYRLPIDGYRYPVPLLDVKRSIRLVRQEASEWNIDGGKIGIMGFSAGGHLAATLETHYDRGNPSAADPVEMISCRPDFVVLVYPLIDLQNPKAASLKNLLLGPEAANAALVYNLSDQTQVNSQTPPTLLIAADDDGIVPVALNSRVMYEALQKAGVPSDFQEYARGGHGFGSAGPPGWIDRMGEWLKSQGIAP